ncbi:PREDICTED: lipoprotein lipase-like [Nicrophorus vespilloides]|uniref:Lipoprotein lipase-like n=1 Tax=Nicrophorus vespilloides TaxID=110193 RepID=A0ABM1MMX8_NICVS|nr:PREDICTED: lipoprotein lipase-like [Nicrophorus vespilloides]
MRFFFCVLLVSSCVFWPLETASIGQRVKRQGVIGDPCEAFNVKLGFHSAKLSTIPKGVCGYCCPIKENDVRFYFVDRTHVNGTLVTLQSKGRALGIDPRLPTIIYVHGFLELGISGIAIRTVREGIFNSNIDMNFLVVDWSNLSMGPWYVEAAQNVRYVSEKVATFIWTHLKRKSFRLDTLHVIGFSLGAQVVGLAGKILKSNGLMLPRITALDPAFPLFHIKQPENRVARGDAEFVDVVHTNPGRFGIGEPIGDADFYPNDDRFYQPGCNFDDVINGNRLDDLASCSHERAWGYYSESIANPQAFPATTCRGFRADAKPCHFQVDAYMGYHLTKNVTGQYFLSTNPQKPYGMPADLQMKMKS